MIKRKSETLIYEDAWLRFYLDTVEFSNGSVGTYTRLERKSGVGVVLINPKNQIVLVKLKRYPIQAESWEIPGGGIEPGQSPLDAAIGEIREEVGILINAKDLVPLGGFYPLNSLSNEYQYLFSCTISETAMPPLQADDSEIIDSSLIDYQQTLQMIKDGSINEVTTIAALLLVREKVSADSH